MRNAWRKSSTRLKTSLLLFLIALLPRLLFVSLFRPLHWDDVGYGWELGQVARAIYEGRGFSDSVINGSGLPTSWFAPVVPLLWAAIFSLFGLFTDLSLVVIVLIDTLASALSAVFLFEIARVLLRQERRFSTGRAGVLALVGSFAPEVIRCTTYPWYVSLLVCSFAAAIAIGLRWITNPTPSRSIRLGLLSGLAVQISPTVLPCFGAIGVFGIYRRWLRSGRLELKGALITAGVGLLAVLPWTVRNYREFHQLIPIRGTFGVELLQGNNERGVARQIKTAVHPSTSPEEWAKYHELGEADYSAQAARRAIRWITSSPGRFIELTVQRFVLFWIGDPLDWYPWDASDRWENLNAKRFCWRIFLLAKNLLLVIALVFVVVVRPRSIGGLVTLTMLLVYPLPYYVTHVHATYSIPIQELLIVFLGAEFISRVKWFRC